ncbi:MAG TPA: response regulator transcription factor [Acidimicrobiales bacterium]|jgi:DNA-binding response OmpR family regulator
MAETPTRILLVEDEAHLAEAIAHGLRAEGFEVTAVSDGIEGTERARHGGHDLVILDILLPGRNGFQICALLRQEGHRFPILMLTAKDGDLDEAEALDTGADDYLTKPFSFVVLVARIRALLRRGHPERGPVITVGDLVLDAAGHRCHRGATEIALTPREFSLLQYLMHAAGDVVTKADILANVWGEQFEGDPNIVEVYAGYLRRKIDVAFDRDALQTVRGVGYRLDAGGG